MNYSQLSKRASWTLLVVTLLLAGLVFFAIGFFAVVIGFIQHLMVPEKPWEFGRSLASGAVILIPALILARFYFVVAARPHSTRYAVVGWSASACYHAIMTWMFVNHLHGSVETTPPGLKIPIWTICAAAALVSLYLLIRFPRPPQLPNDAAVN